MTQTNAQIGSQPAFAAIYAVTKHSQSVCTLALLAWVAACDGRIAPREQALLDQIAQAVDDVDDLATVQAAAKLSRAEDLLLACRYLKQNLDRGGKRLLFQLAITMAIVDSSLGVAENHLLQFLADVLGIRPRTVGKLFVQIAHRPFPQAGDPSSLQWWQQRESGAMSSSHVADPATEAGEPEDERDVDGPLIRAVALQVMGLDEGATRQQVHAAYRKLAKARHPDRFAPLGAAAVSTASIAFTRLHDAYAVLSQQP